MNSFIELINTISNFEIMLISAVADFWWLISFIIFFPLFTGLWLWLRQAEFKEKITWVMLEIRPPREVRKSPKAMEQIITSIYTLRNSPGNFFEKWWDGEVTRWFSLEAVSFGGEVHFFLRTPIKFKNIIEANFYAHYPDVEIFVVDDYINTVPKTTKELYDAGFNLYGSELILEKDDAYPIRTYIQFEAPEEEQKLDPVSALLEGLGKLKRDEQFFMQILIRPTDSKWREKGQRLIEELKTKQMFETKNQEDKKIKIPIGLTPGQIEIIKAVEANMARPGFETIIRLLYIAPKEIFDDTFANKGVQSILNQYSAMNLNSFKHNNKIKTSRQKWYEYPYFRLDARLEGRKQRILQTYINRSYPEELTIGKFLNLDPANFNFESKYFVLNSEELATIYHLPYYFVLTAPFIPKLGSKKIGPPAGLPIYKENN